MEPFTPLTDLFDAYDRAKLRGGKPSTRKQYRITLRNLTTFVGRVPRMSDLSDDLITDAAWWMVGRGRSKATANKLRANLVAIWHFACRRGWLPVWPTVPRLLEPERIPIAWLRSELHALFAECSRQPGKISGVPADLWWHGLHAVIWDTGERIGAVMQLDWSAVSLAAATVTFRAETRKGETRDTLRRLHSDTISLLRSIRAPSRDRVFPWPFSPGYVWTRYKLILERAGLPSDRRHKFHCMRRSVASYFEAAGGNATALLDHSSRGITERYYLDQRITGQGPAACDLLFRPGERSIAGT